jgi:hypothetical protein
LVENFGTRRSYSAPDLTHYGKLESLTGALVCTNLSNKVGYQADDITPSIPQLVGDEKCV